MYIKKKETGIYTIHNKVYIDRFRYDTVVTFFLSRSFYPFGFLRYSKFFFCPSRFLMFVIGWTITCGPKEGRYRNHDPRTWVKGVFVNDWVHPFPSHPVSMVTVRLSSSVNCDTTIDKGGFKGWMYFKRHRTIYPDRSYKSQMNLRESFLIDWYIS